MRAVPADAPRRGAEPRPDPVSLVAGIELVALGGLLLAGALDVFTPTFAVLAPAMAAAVGIILVVLGLQPSPSGAGRAAPARAVLRRDPDRRWIGGVCSGVAGALGVDPMVVRIAFVVAGLAGGLGVVVYLVAWFALPAERGEDRPAAARGVLAVALGVSLLCLAALLAMRGLGIWFGDAIVWPLVLVAGGVALLWRRGRTEPEPDVTVAAAPPERETRGERISRTGVGAALVVAAGLAFLQATGALGAVRDVALATIAVAAVLGVIFAPSIVRLVRSRDAERAARVRSQERAEVAAHLHDSVLQTLALVQQRADDPRAVAQLARRQERELRRWLAGETNGAGSFARALETTAEEVERDHRVVIDTVIVGDAPLDDRTTALLAAAREAMVNAARYGGGEPVAVYAEAGGGRAEIDVRDRGPGFDLAGVPAERRGVRESIIGRMHRHGGTASIGPAPGGGTEVELAIALGDEVQP